MKEEKTKIQASIYKIDETIFEEISRDDIVNKIIDSYNSKTKDSEKFIDQKLSRSDFGNFKVKVLYASKMRTPKWRPFWKDVVDDDAALKSCYNTDASYLTFVIDNKNIYAVSGGQGNFIIQDYIDLNFGINILTRLISKDSNVIKSLQDRGVTGSIIGSTKFFRGNYKLSDEDQFGKIYKQIKAELKKDVLLKEFGFSEDDIKRNAGCLAKSSFQINKSIDFDTLLEVLGKITHILDRDELFSLNKVSLLSNKGQKNKDLLKNLEKHLFGILFDFCTKGGELDFDFAHPDFEKYFTANKYVVEKAGKVEIASFDELDSLCDFLSDTSIRSSIDLTDLEKFLTSLHNLRIKSIDSDGGVSTQAGVRYHIHGEVTYNECTYFLIDNRWYEIRADFVNDLNKDTKELVNQNIDNSILDEKCTLSDDENLYNQKFIKDGYVVLDKITPENIELCDILKVTNDAIHLVHVKKGFDNSIRDLASQILISARRLQLDRKSGYQFIDLVESKLKGGAKSDDDYLKRASGQNIPEGSLKKTFQCKKDKEICFCFAFVDTATTERSIKSPECFRSNIAKFSLIELEKEIHRAGFGFAVIQIEKD